MNEKVGVVGAGLMGAEIALVFALAGHEVVLSDTGEAALSAAMERLARVLDRGIPRGFTENYYGREFLHSVVISSSYGLLQSFSGNGYFAE